MTATPEDIGDLLEVPEEERLDYDPPAAYNADAGFDTEVVPDGEYVELSTADDSEPIAADSARRDDDGDGAPLGFLRDVAEGGQ